MSNTTVTFKIVFSENDLRRFKVEKMPSYADFIRMLKDNYSNYFYNDRKFMIKYHDSEMDKIAVDSQLEWEEMIHELSGNKIVKIHIEWIEEKKEEKKTLEEECVNNVNELLGGFGTFMEQLVSGFQDMNVQENVDKWMECSSVKKSKRMFWKLHRMSLECLDSLDSNVIMKGKEYLLQMLEIIPGHAIALYNLACADSLLGNVKEALESLENAIKAGYNNLEHMLNDKDFNNIKDSEGFRKIVEDLTKRIYGEVKEEKVEEPVVEKVEPVVEKVEEKKVEPVVEKVEPVVEKVEEKKEVVAPVDPVEVSLDTLNEIFGIPKEILKEMMTQCKNNVDQVVELIYSGRV